MKVADIVMMQAEVRADIETLKSKTQKVKTAQDFLIDRMLQRQDKMLGAIATFIAEDEEVARAARARYKTGKR